MNNHPEENLPLDEDMVNRATKAMEALVGPLLAGQADNPYLDAEQYTKALCKAYADQVLNAAFHGLGRIEWATKEQVREERKPGPSHKYATIGVNLERHDEAADIDKRLRDDSASIMYTNSSSGVVWWWMSLEGVPKVAGKNIRDRDGHALTRYPHGWVYLEGPQARKYFSDGSGPINGPYTEVI